MRVVVLFYDTGLDDKSILAVLTREGFNVGYWTLLRIRKDLDMLRRLSPFQAEAQNTRIEELVQQELDRGVILPYGRGMLHQYFKMQGHIISRYVCTSLALTILIVIYHRDCLFSRVKLLYPKGIERRKYDLQRHRGKYILPGPNFTWSVDGYMKLASFGIEVYAGIDGYSRYVVWIYVGVSSRTAVSVLKQYLEIVQHGKKQPRFLRSDRGTETMMAASAHWKLAQCSEPNLDLREC